MFSRIDPLFKTLFRHAEGADTRQDIKRKAPEQERSKSKEDHIDPKDNPLWEDETDVSIEALTSFLQTLLGDKNHIFNNQSAQTQNPTASGPTSKTSETQPSAYAINAYQKTSGEEPPTINISEDQPSNEFNIEEKDRPTIEKLLGEVKDLKKLGIEYLVISKRGTFFESVKDAIEKAHDTFNL